MSESTELVVIEAQSAVQIFTGGGMQSFLDDIEAKVRAIPLDPSTHEGRELIRSTAYKIARTKTALDAEGKKLTEGWREATAKVNAERKKSAERLEALQDEIRKPLTDFENKEKLRVAAHEEALCNITGLHAMLAGYPDMTLALLLQHQGDLAAMLPGYEWEEFAQRAATARAECDKYLAARIESRRRFEDEQAELARLRREEAARKQREHEDRIKAEAAEKARIEAERKAKEAADAEAKRVIEAAEAERKRVADEAERVRAENERKQRAAEDSRRQEEQARLAAELRAREAEEAKLAAERKAAADLKAAEEKAKRDADAAAQRERERIAEEHRKAEEERQKREANQRLRARVRSEIRADISVLLGTEVDYSTSITDALLSGQIRHVKVTF